MVPGIQAGGNYGKKGTGLAIKGRIKTDSYTKDINGQETTFYSTKVVADKITFVGSKSTNTAAAAPAPAQTTGAPAATAPSAPAPAQVAEAQTQEYVNTGDFANGTTTDDLPF